MRAGNLDVLIETGAKWTRQVEVYAPDEPIAAQLVVAGQRLFVDGLPLLVYAVMPASNNRVSIQFGRGLYNDITLTVSATANVIPAEPQTIDEVVAAWTYAPPPVLDVEPPAVTVDIPAIIAPDALSFALTYTADETAAMDGMVGANSWDCYVRTAAWDWQRILEGTLTVIKGDSR